MNCRTIRISELFGHEEVVARSQARRVMARFEQFAEVLLDFTAVDFIGQAFADEVFRVFQRGHPQIKLHVAHAKSAVTNMIRRAQAAAKRAATPPSES